MALRTSKYRNTTSNVYRTEFQYPNLSLSTASGDGTVVAGNLFWIALAWHSNVGGAVAVLPADQPGRRNGNPYLLNGHSGQINEMAWNPFHEWILATAASDGLAKVWKLPEQGLTSDTNEAFATLSGHGKRVDTLAWHPSAANILATGGSDNTVRVWDINAASGGEKLKLSHFADNVDSIAWNYDGSLLAAASRDKKIRVFDPRTSSVLAVRKFFNNQKIHSNIAFPASNFIPMSQQANQHMYGIMF
jgi:coronin-1B/1C/6